MQKNPYKQNRNIQGDSNKMPHQRECNFSTTDLDFYMKFLKLKQNYFSSLQKLRLYKFLCHIFNSAMQE